MLASVFAFLWVFASYSSNSNQNVHTCTEIQCSLESTNTTRKNENILLVHCWTPSDWESWNHTCLFKLNKIPTQQSTLLTYLFTLPPGVYRVLWSAHLCVWLFVCSHISKTSHTNFTNFSARFTGRGLVLLWRQCDTLCTSSFVDDVNIMQEIGQD